jgi:hypothetical protein
MTQEFKILVQVTQALWRKLIEFAYDLFFGYRIGAHERPLAALILVETAIAMLTS